MLQLNIPIGREGWDDVNEEFIAPKVQTIQLEHSLISLSKWESKWCKPFFSRQDKSNEEILDYIKCMTVTQNVKPEIYDYLTQDNILQIQEYIEAPMTATRITKGRGSKSSGEEITSELIYYWMIALNIPVEFEKWHIKRLLTLIEICNIKNQPAKKMSKREIMSRNATLNAARRQQMNTRG